MNAARLAEIDALIRPGKSLRCFKPEQKEQRDLLRACRDLRAEIQPERPVASDVASEVAWIEAVLELLIHPQPKPGTLDEYVSVPTLVRKANDKLNALAVALDRCRRELAEGRDQ